MNLEQEKSPAGLTVEGAAAVLYEKGGRFEIEPVLVGPIAVDEVLVEIVACGICHTDLSVRDQRRPVPLPAIVGHEGAGIVRAVGPAVRSVAAGDSVILSYLSCGQCPECAAGWSASCHRLGPLCFASGRPDGSHAVRARNGTTLSDRFFGQSSFSNWAVANQRNAIPVASDLPLEYLAPLGCGVITGAGAVWNELQVTAGSSFAVFGAGSVGLSAILAARVAGAQSIVAVDRVTGRLNLARELGATHTIDSSKISDVPAAILSILGDGVDSALDTTGNSEVINAAFRALRQRGTLAVAATTNPGQSLTLPQLQLMTGCRRIVGVIEGGASAQQMIPTIIELYRAGRFPFDRFVTLYDFDRINEAVEACESGETVKAVLRMRPQSAASNSDRGA